MIEKSLASEIEKKSDGCHKMVPSSHVRTKRSILHLPHTRAVFVYAVTAMVQEGQNSRVNLVGAP